MPPTYLLDTGVLLLLVRGGAIGQRLDSSFALRSSAFRPLICSVSVGELWALAEIRGYGTDKRRAVQLVIDNTVVVDINDPIVVAAYVEVYKVLHRHPTGSRTSIGGNDMWIAAATRAANATLLTTDKDFDPLHPSVIQRVLIPRGGSRT